MIISLFLIFIIYLQLIMLKKKQSIPKVLRILLIVSFTTWYVIPFSISVFSSWDSFEPFVRISLSKYLVFFNYELAFYCIILALFHLNKLKSRNQSYIITDCNDSNKHVFETFSILYLVVLFGYKFIYNSNYLDNNEIATANSGSKFIIEFISQYFISYYWVSIVFFEKIKHRKIFIIILVFISLYFIFSGSRVYLLSLIYLFIFTRKKNKSKLLQKTRYVQLAVIISIAAVLLPIISAKRSGDDFNLTKSDSQLISKLVLNELNIKLNNTAYGSVLITEDGSGFAGINPYLGSVLKFIPRAIWPSKPTPTSFNGDVSGTPARHIPELLNLDSSTANVGYSPFAVSYWQMGIITVILSICINVIYLTIISNFLGNPSRFIKAIGWHLLYFPQLILTPNTGDNLIQKILEIAIILFLLVLSRLIYIKKRKLINA